jgi:hypothetical protein
MKSRTCKDEKDVMQVGIVAEEVRRRNSELNDKQVKR